MASKLIKLIGSLLCLGAIAVRVLTQEYQIPYYMALIAFTIYAIEDTIQIINRADE